ncbi:hypothetical protein M422DRAFT_774866 [Sphaerobolus stellatus SS14]|nr:hypothetical protein M422DRAFT_774866 [Sphaerobolus stellatus SS14]
MPESVEAAKRMAAYAAVDRHIHAETSLNAYGVLHSLLIRAGSTVPYVVDRIVSQGREVNSRRVFLSTDSQSKELIIKVGLASGEIEQFLDIDVTIDGFDEVDEFLNCIKSAGACHLREKVLAEAAKTFIVVANYRKHSKVLGTTYTSGIPIKVTPFAYIKLLQELRSLGSLRMTINKAGPAVSDNGNSVINAPFPPEELKQPHFYTELDTQ